MLQVGVSVLLTLNDRPLDTVEAVLASVRQQGQAETVVALDRTPTDLAKRVRRLLADDGYGAVKTPEIAGSPGWRSPVPAWNLALGHATGDTLYCISSDTVQAAGNVERATALLGQYGKPAVLFGAASCSCGPEGKEVDWGGTAPGSLLVDSLHPRPLGFIMAMPRATMTAAGGYDEGFTPGYWYDDDALVYSLWQTGADFLFADAVTGLHLHHERPMLDTPAGQSGIAHNRAYILGKYGSERPIATVAKRVVRRPGLTVWQHP